MCRAFGACGLAGGCVAFDNGFVISTVRMNRILKIDRQPVDEVRSHREREAQRRRGVVRHAFEARQERLALLLTGALRVELLELVHEQEHSNERP